MPEGMVLKSEGNGSNLYDPEGELTLKRFCADRGLPYKDIGMPIPLSTFIDYGIAFQQRFVPRLEDRLVTDVKPTSYGFELDLMDGGGGAGSPRDRRRRYPRLRVYAARTGGICRPGWLRTVRGM